MARESFNTNILRGYFDTKVWNGSKPREQWASKGQEDTISFGVTFNELPEAFREFAREYQNRDGQTMYRVTFKIGRNCKWQDSFGDPLPTRPLHADMEGKKFDVVINYNVLHADPNNDKAPSGYWANYIMYREVEQNPLAGMHFDEKPAAPVAEEAVAEPEQESDELDF